MSRLIQAEEQGDVLTQGELLSTCILLLVAGHETSVNLIAGGALALMEHPDQLVRFRHDPGVRRSGVEEMLRYVGPVQLTGRVALEAIDVGGVTSVPGNSPCCSSGRPTVTPEAFADPDTFDVGRADNNHLGFGFGIHHCLGAPLARLEAQVALAALVGRARVLERAGDELVLQGEHRAARADGAAGRLTPARRPALRQPSQSLRPAQLQVSGASRGHEGPGAFALGHQGQVEQELLLVVAADDLHADGEAVDGADGDGDGRVARPGWPAW